MAALGSGGDILPATRGHQAPFQLLVGDERHGVPGAELQERGHEPPAAAKVITCHPRVMVPPPQKCLRFGRGEKRVANPYSPLVESLELLISQQGEGTAPDAPVLAWSRVHVPRLHHVHGGDNERGPESVPEGRGEVAGDAF